MNDGGKSDRVIVPKKSANKVGQNVTAAEQVEGSTLTKGKSSHNNTRRTQSRDSVQSILGTIRNAAKRERKMRFTALYHHIYDIRMLRYAYLSINRDALPGVDGETWKRYGEIPDENLQDLSERLKRGAYRAKPVKRVYIPKPDGKQRPLGIPALEDKIVQRATVEVLNCQTFSGEFIHNVQHSDLSSIIELILHEVVSPNMVGIQGFGRIGQVWAGFRRFR